MWEKHVEWLLHACTPTELGIESVTQVYALDQESNLEPFGAQADALTSEPHWPELAITFWFVPET